MFASAATRSATAYSIGKSAFVPSAGASRVVAAAFNQRRKMLRASLKGVAPDIEHRLLAAGIQPTERAEQVPLEAFCALARSIASP